MIGVSLSSRVSIWPAMVRWVPRSDVAMYWLDSLSYWELLKCAAFQEPVPFLALVVCSGAVRNTFGTLRCP